MRILCGKCKNNCDVLDISLDLEGHLIPCVRWAYQCYKYPRFQNRAARFVMAINRTALLKLVIGFQLNTDFSLAVLM